METTNQLFETIENKALKAHLKNIELYHVDYRDAMESEDLQSILDTGYTSENYLIEWETDAHTIATDAMSKLDIDECEFDYVLDVVYATCSNDPIPQLIKNAGPQPVRLTAISNYEGVRSACDNSHGYEYSDGLKDYMDILNLNPATVKKSLVAQGLKTRGAFPNRKARDGKEYITAENFARELANTMSSCNELVFVGLVDARDFYGKEKTTVTFPKGNSVGLFDRSQGSGSIIECELLRPFTVDIKKLHGESIYDSWELSIDSQGSGYSIDSVYGVDRQFWGGEIY